MPFTPNGDLPLRHALGLQRLGDEALGFGFRRFGNTLEHPLFGSGPGTFQRPYALLKLPESEMARLARNDYLEQFSDSGVLGGVIYLAWIGLLLGTIARRTLLVSPPTTFAISVGLLGWFAQGLSEFGLYIPALAWTAFALAGGVLRLTAHQEEC